MSRKQFWSLMLLLTDWFIGNKGFVVEAENLGYIVQIWMLDDERPKRIVHSIVEVCDGDLHPPVFLIILFHVPVNSNRAHMMRALQQRGVVFLWCIDSNQLKNLRITPAVIAKHNTVQVWAVLMAILTRIEMEMASLTWCSCSCFGNHRCKTDKTWSYRCRTMRKKHNN